MSKKYVLIPLRTFTDLCSQTKKTGDTITGVLKNLTEHETKKRQRPFDKKRSGVCCTNQFDL